MHRWTLVILVLIALVMPACRIRSGPDNNQPQELVHVVAPGETLSDIARTYGVDTLTIIDANNLREVTLTPGMRLVIPGGRRPAPPPATRKEPQPTPPTSGFIIPRSGWNAPPPDSSHCIPMKVKPWRITIHHTADASLDHLEGPELPRKTDQAHRNRRDKDGQPWACIGYHFMIDRKGQVFEGRPLELQGAHAQRDNNIGNIGISLGGNFETEKPPAAQVQALTKLVRILQERFGIDKRYLYGHCDFVKDTACPGRNLKPVVAELRGGAAPAPIVNRPPGKG